MIGAETEEGWQKERAFQQWSSSLNVFDEEEQVDSHGNRSRNRSLSSEMMEAWCDKLVEEYEDQENPACR